MIIVETLAELKQLENPIAVFVIGTIGSGKSYITKKYLDWLPLIDIDNITSDINNGVYLRKNISKAIQESKKMIDYKIQNNESFINNATGGSTSFYNKLKRVRENKNFKTIIVFVHCNIETAINRVNYRNSVEERQLPVDKFKKISYIYDNIPIILTKCMNSNLIDYYCAYDNSN